MQKLKTSKPIKKDRKQTKSYNGSRKKILFAYYRNQENP
jgi:hypothetical protein